MRTDLQSVILKQTQQIGMRQIYEQLNGSGIDAHKLNASVNFKPAVLCIIFDSYQLESCVNATLRYRNWSFK